MAKMYSYPVTGPVPLTMPNLVCRFRQGREGGAGVRLRLAGSGQARLNALPQFMTTIDGEDIHFIHVRSKHPNALPVIVTHGWPGSIIEQLKIIDPLTNPEVDPIRWTSFRGSLLARQPT